MRIHADPDTDPKHCFYLVLSSNAVSGMAIIGEGTVLYLTREASPERISSLQYWKNDNLRFFIVIHLTENHIYTKKTFRGGRILFCPKVYKISAGVTNTDD